MQKSKTPFLSLRHVDIKYVISYIRDISSGLGFTMSWGPYIKDVGIIFLVYHPSLPHASFSLLMSVFFSSVSDPYLLMHHRRLLCTTPCHIRVGPLCHFCNCNHKSGQFSRQNFLQPKPEDTSRIYIIDYLLTYILEVQRFQLKD